MKFLKFWFPVIGYSAIIFLVSSLPNVRVPGQFPLTDKIVHVFEYSLLGILAVRALLNTTPWTGRIVFLVAIMVCFLFGLTDEYHQSFVPGRDSSMFDALADFLGANIGAGVYLLVLSKYFKAIRHKGKAA